MGWHILILMLSLPTKGSRLRSIGAPILDAMIMQKKYGNKKNTVIKNYVSLPRRRF